MIDNISRRDALKRLFASAASGVFLPSIISCQKNRKSKPNIILIMADDLGYGDLSCYGCPDIRTYNIDQIAKEGVKFTQFYVSAPVCSPTRASLLTGRYQQRTGVETVLTTKFKDKGLSLKERLLPEYLKGIGYVTGIVGKWHLGYEKKYFPTRRGFDKFYGFVSGNIDYYTHCNNLEELDLYRGETLVEEEGYMTDLITGEAVNFIDRHKNERFFLYVPYGAPHSPYQPPGETLNKKRVPYTREPRFSREIFIQMVECMDRGIGKILERIGKYGLNENTLIIFLSDNGGTRSGRNAPLHDGKGNLFEGGVHVPFMMKWQNHIPEGKVFDIPAIDMDIFTTILSSVGISKPEDIIIDGNDLMPIIEGKTKKNHEYLCWLYLNNEAVRKDNWKYHKTKDGREFLIDLSSDIGEENNLIDKYPEKTGELKNILEKWKEEVI